MFLGIRDLGRRREIRVDRRCILCLEGSVVALVCGVGGLVAYCWGGGDEDGWW